MEALGMVEVRGYLGAVGVADATLKAANVTLLGLEIIRGGLTTVEVVGDVSAVDDAINVGIETAKKLNCLIGHHVISHVDTQTEVILSDLKPDLNLDINPKKIETLPTEIVAEENGFSETEDSPQLKQLRSKRVVDLRKQAYKMNLSNLKKSEIKVANKEKLIQAIMAEIERSDNEWN
jgi:microcompartment protein CcmL/EutN